MVTPFTKMHGLGNDFIVLDNRAGALVLTGPIVRRLADRRRGIGCDQLLVIGPPDRDDADLAFRIFNADGSEVEHCGNGARCIAAYARARGLCHANPLRLQLPTRCITARTLDGGDVAVDMGPPAFEPAVVPFDAPERALVYTLDQGASTLELGVVSMGNPHAVIAVNDTRTLDLAALAGPLQAHRRFPEGVNVGAMTVLARDRIRLRVCERGVGETHACGTGACAAVAVARLWGLVDDRVTVELTGGTLVIEWPGEGASLWMTGAAEFVFEGEVEL